MASAVQQSEVSAGEIVLGLLLEHPDTCYRLDKRMAECLGAAQFSRGAAAGAVKRLLERDFVRPAASEEHEGGMRANGRAIGGPVVDGRKKTVYEPTPAGVAHFKRWLRASTQTPPVREELHAKIALWGSEDLTRLIEIVREGEMTCTLQLKQLNQRMQFERRASGSNEWARTMQLIVRSGEAAWWDTRIRWLQEVRLFLEKQCARPPGAGGGQPAVR
jgi:hypothetical protein